MPVRMNIPKEELMEIKTEKIYSIKKLSEKEHTYDLQVRDNNNFVLSNGVLSSNCISTIWIYPTDFISRNSVYGFETYGKDLKNKLVRLIVYDLRKSMFGMFTPLGYIVVPKIQDLAYQKIPEDNWSDYRKQNKKLGRPDFDSLLEEKYEMKKDEWLGKEQKGEQGIIAKERYKLGAWVGQQKQFQDAKNKKRQRILVQNLFPQFTSAEIDDIVEIGRMGLDYSEIEKIAKKRHAEEKGEKIIEEEDIEQTEQAKVKRTVVRRRRQVKVHEKRKRKQRPRRTVKKGKAKGVKRRQKAGVRKMRLPEKREVRSKGRRAK